MLYTFLDNLQVCTYVRIDLQNYQNMRNTIIAGGLTLALLLISLIWMGFLSMPSKSSSWTEAIPASSIAVLETKQLDVAVNELFGSVHSAEFGNFDLTNELLTTLNSLKSLTDISGDEVLSRPWVASLHLVKANAYDYLLMSPASNVNSFKASRLLSVLESKNISISSSQFKKVKIYEATLPQGKLNFAFTDGLVLLSQYSFLVEEAISTLSGSAEGWNIKNRNLEDQNFRLYTNGENLALLNSIFLKPQLNESMLSQLSNILDIAVSDISFENKNLKLSTRFSIDKNHDFLRVLLEQEAGGKSSLSEVVPKKTAFLSRYSVEDFESFKTSLSHRNIYASASIDDYISPWIGQEWSYGICKKDYRAQSELSFITVQTRNAERTVSMLEEMNGTDFKADKYQGFNIRFLDQPSLFEFLFDEKTASNFANAHYAVFDDQVIFCNNIKFLKEMIDAYKAGEILATSNDYKRFQAAHNSAANLNVFIQTDQLKEILKENASQSFLTSIESKFAQYAQMSSIGLSADKYGNAFLANSHIYYSGTGQAIGQWIASPIKTQVATNSNSNPKTQNSNHGIASTNKAIWETALKASPVMEPQYYKNHSTKEINVFVQDEENRVYLVDPRGKILWEKVLAEAIVPPVKMVDILLNNKNQLLFNTSDKLYVIDRLGNHVKGFPVDLKAKATSGTGHVYYAGDKKHRFFVATEGGKIYGYQGSGKPLTGWSPLEGIGNVSMPLVHTEYNGKDYLMVATTEGMVMGLNRHGKTRMPTVELNQGLAKPLEIARTSDNKKVIKAYTADGMLYKIGFDGSSVKSASDTYAESDIKDFDKDGQKERIRLGRESLAMVRVE